MFNVLKKVKDLLLSFGGHAAAAGLSLRADQLPILKQRLSELVEQTVHAEDFQPRLSLDAELTLREANSKLMRDLAYLEPFGCENTVPVFYIRNAALVGKPIIMKEVHVKCQIFSDGTMKQIVFFNRPDIIKKLHESSRELCDVAVQVTENYWRDDVRIELQGLDIAFHET